MESTLGYKPSFSKNWLVVYTRPRWEKKVDRLLKLQCIESFCPLRNVESQWADRKKMVALPLFNSYVFVRINEREEYKVRYTLGVLNFVNYMGKPAIIRENEMERLQQMMKIYQNADIVNLNEVSMGDRVRIKNGLFNHVQGEVLQIQGKNVLMTFDHLDCALVTRVPVTDLVITNKNQPNYV